MMNFPDPSICSAPCGMTKAVRGPVAMMRGPEIRTMEFETGGPPVPSIRTAPTITLTLAVSGGLQLSQEKTSRKTGRTEQASRPLRMKVFTAELLRFAVHTCLGHQLGLVVVSTRAVDEIALFHLIDRA